MAMPGRVPRKGTIVQLVNIAAPAATTSSGSSWLSFLPILLIVVVFYLLLLRPMRKRQQAQARDAAQLRSNLEAGDEIVTIGGLYGTVVSTDDESVYLEIAPGVNARYDLKAVARKVTSSVQDTETDTEDDETDTPDPADSVVERND
jgi:preprotein translocase subunit YajC